MKNSNFSGIGAELLEKNTVLANADHRGLNTEISERLNTLNGLDNLLDNYQQLNRDIE